MRKLKLFAAIGALSTLVVAGALLSRPRPAPVPEEPAGTSQVSPSPSPASVADQKKVLLKGLGMS
jgi:hypothetical protein